MWRVFVLRTMSIASASNYSIGRHLSRPFFRGKRRATLGSNAQCRINSERVESSHTYRTFPCFASDCAMMHPYAYRCFFNSFRVDETIGPCPPGWLVPRDPGLIDTIPSGLKPEFSKKCPNSSGGQRTARPTLTLKPLFPCKKFKYH